MSHVPVVGKKALSSRSYMFMVYLGLIVLGTTMVVPFLITASGSVANDFDYRRYYPVPRYFWSGTDRFSKGLVYFFNKNRGWNKQMRAYYPDMPGRWATWGNIGADIKGSDNFATQYMQIDESTRTKAQDYSEFADNYPLEDTQAAVENFQAIDFLKAYYLHKWKIQNPEEANKASRAKALEQLNKDWQIPFKTFYNVKFSSEMRAPMGFQSWYPKPGYAKYRDFMRLKNAYRNHFFTPGVKGKWLSLLDEKNIEYEYVTDIFPVTEKCPQDVKELWGKFKAEVAPASPTIPYALRADWYKFLASDVAIRIAKLKYDATFSIETYNQLAGTNYKILEKTPFPIPAKFNPRMQKLWSYFALKYFPMRLSSVKPDLRLTTQYQNLLKKDLKTLKMANELLGTKCSSWAQFKLSPVLPKGPSKSDDNRRSIWMNFVKQLPKKDRILSSSEIAFQKFLFKKYGSLAKINETYKWNLKYIQEAFPPFAAAYAVTAYNNEAAFVYEPIMSNYKVVIDFLLLNGRAIPVTFFLICLAVLCTLTVNPLAAYALSRFNLKGKDKILLFMLATMAFPAMVSAIPAYLLMRDIGLLNTFFALILPGAANGMAIFILKGFFDSLPMELFEAATIDGATEMQIFRIVAMPLVKPILAINSLAAFIAAYNGWQWALIICQDKDMWTIAVWLFQASIWWKDMPWVVSAGFIIASIPTFIVFVSCQKIILRGIIIPSMK